MRPTRRHRFSLVVVVMSCCGVLLGTDLGLAQSVSIPDFDDPRWSPSNGIWEFGLPTSGPGGCYGPGDQLCAATILAGSYDANTDSRLVSPSLDLPAVGPTQALQLRFWHWFSYSSNDSGTVEVAVFDPNAGSFGPFQSVGEPYGGVSAVWTPVHVDLTAFAGKRVRLGFSHVATDTCCDGFDDRSSGWYIDDLTIEAVTPTFTGDFESGWADWSVSSGIWEIGAATSGPGSCLGGTQCAGTVLGGAYEANKDSRLVSAPIDLPLAGAGQEVQLRFWHWFSYSSNDFGTVEVAVFDEATKSFGPFEPVSDPYGGVSVVWTPVHLDLTAFAGKRVRLGFSHVAADTCCDGFDDRSTGWYIDDLTIVAVAPSFTGDFESGWADWSVSSGIWEIGAATSGPGSCLGGTQCAGTVLGGAYEANKDSRLVSAPIDLPVAAAGQEVQLRFWHWFSYSSNDFGTVEVAVFDEGTESFGPFEPVSEPYGGVSLVWTPVHLDLTAFAGKRVRLGFSHVATDTCCDGFDDRSSGWYVDDLAIVAVTPTFTGDFESGWADWSVSSGIWEIGAATSGPGSCVGGAQCAGTVLGGAYEANKDSRLVSAPIHLPSTGGGDELLVRFQHWFSYSSNDSGSLQISALDDATGDYSTWETAQRVGGGLAQYTGVSGAWTSANVDVTAYSGKTVRLGFLHVATDTCCDGFDDRSTGWYVDNICLVLPSGQQQCFPSIAGTPTPSSTRTPTPTPTATPAATLATATKTATPVKTQTPTPSSATATTSTTPTRSTTPTPSDGPGTPTPTPTAECPPGAECFTGPLPLTSDEEHDGPTAQDPIETEIIGDCQEGSIIEQPLKDRSDRGYQFLGQSIAIDTCDATPTDPITIIFEVHRSVMRVPHQRPVTLWVYREGKAIEPCQGGAVEAVPAPCVAKREEIEDGVRFTILTDHASPWNVGNGLDAFLCRSAKAGKDAPKLAAVETDVDAGDGTRFLHALKPGALCAPVGTAGAGAVDASTFLQSFALKARKVCADDHARACSAKNVCPTGAKCVKQDPIATARVVTVQTGVGSLALEAASPTSLFVPSAAGAAGGDPDPLDPDAHSVASFACAKAKLADGSVSVAGRAIALKDDPGTEPTTYVLGKPSALCSPVTFEGTAPVNDATHLVCFKVKRAGKRCANTAVLNAAAPCKRESDCGGQRGDSFCQAQSKDVASSLAVSTPLQNVRGLQREVGKTSVLCLPATIE